MVWILFQAARIAIWCWLTYARKTSKTPTFAAYIKPLHMILFFGSLSSQLFAVEVATPLSEQDRAKLSWLFGQQPQLVTEQIEGPFIGPRAAMITPWSTNAVEITQNMAIEGISRIEEFQVVQNGALSFDPMLSQQYQQPNVQLGESS